MIITALNRTWISPFSMVYTTSHSVSSVGSQLTVAHVVQEAEAAEQSDPPMVATCRAIVSAVISIGVEEEDRKRTWMADAEVCQIIFLLDVCSWLEALANEVPLALNVWRPPSYSTS